MLIAGSCRHDLVRGQRGYVRPNGIGAQPAVAGIRSAPRLLNCFKKTSRESGPRTAQGAAAANPRKVNSKSAEFGWTFGFTAHEAYTGKDKYKKPLTNIRFFATLYPGILQTAVPAKSKIMTYADLANKNISPGKVVFSGNITTERLLKLYGITYAGIKKKGGTIHRVGYKDSVALMKDGHIDAFVGLTTVPNASFLALDFSPGVRFLPVENEIADKFVKQNPGFWKANIKPADYKGVSKPVQTLATATVLIINKDIPNELVYKMTAAFWNNHGEILKVHKNWQHVKLADALKAATRAAAPWRRKILQGKRCREVTPVSPVDFRRIPVASFSRKSETDVRGPCQRRGTTSGGWRQTSLIVVARTPGDTGE